MVSQHIVELCTSQTTVISELAKDSDPGQPASRVAKRLFKNHVFKKHTTHVELEDEADVLGIVASCGNFPYRPSNLFLQVYRDVLQSLDTHPFAGLVSPPLLGSSGVTPLSIVSVIPDIMRHYAELIVHAKVEILLATNYWENSGSSGIIADALRTLSKRVEARGGEKVVIKLMYDRGNLMQAVKNRIAVKPSYWSRLGIPTEDEIPGVSLEVVNYHRPLLGTFHAKFLVVDRRVACLNSNNIQDRPNVEMMVQFEGPVVDSIYDMALLSWSNAMNPPLPFLTRSPSFPYVYKFQQDNEDLKYIDPEVMSKATRAYLRTQRGINEAQEAQHHPSVTMPSAKPDANSSALGRASPGTSGTPNPGTSGSGEPVRDENSRPVANLPTERGVGITSNIGNGATDAATPSDTKTTDHQGATSQDDAWSNFRPHILHEAHGPVPIAIVNRCPTGRPGHYRTRRFPQDIAWLGAMHYAQKSVFIQTPTFNASPIVSSVLDTCRRGVQVTLYLDLGFNDQGEMIPFQGGTNEEVVHGMYTTLNSEGDGAEKHLEVFWYTGKDQTKPLSAAIKKRNCHVKFMAVDDQIAILGSGNQDTQSWFHSQEVNVMVDSPELVGTWMRGIDANQNTRLHGRVSDRDGIWRGQDGEVIQATGVEATGFFKRLKGLYKVVARVRGTGGF